MITRTELEKGDFINKTCKEALPLVAKMICMSHKENREKRFEFEASWMTEETGRLHKIIAKDLRVRLYFVKTNRIKLRHGLRKK